MTDKPIPQMHPVESSNIVSVGYRPEARELHVKFKSGGHYRYADVGPDLHDKFMKAESKGRHHTTEIAGKFKHEKVQVDAG